MRSERYFNRELSWLEFNARVLKEAQDRSTPLLERVRFLSIVSSNLDEFFMVRVASLKAQIRSGDTRADPSGMTPSEQCSSIAQRARDLVAEQYECLAEILPALEREGVAIARPDDWSHSERRWLDAFFAEKVFPLLTPQRVEEKEEGGYVQFPSTGNLRLHAAFLLAEEKAQESDAAEGAPGLAVVQVPHNVERFVRIPSESSGLRLALVEEIVRAFGSRLFPGWTIRESILFKVTRDADFGVDEERDGDFLAAMEEVLAGRQNSWPVRLTVSGSSAELKERLRAVLGLSDDDVYELPGPIDLRGFMELAQADYIPSSAAARLRYRPWTPVQSLEVPEDSTLWEEIEKADRLLHVPYESYAPVSRFIDEAADDPSVLAIKMTLYRTSGNSPVVRALTRAARSGKQVAVLVELKARFDEERNMTWANRLEQAGAIVVYGIARLKVHAKAALVVRRSEDGSIKRYLHLSTGNYNDRTARLYADLSLFTADEGLCREASIFFNAITGYSAVQELGRLAVAPFDLKSRLISLIRREAQRSSAESPGLIMAKMNALADIDVIDALYEANAAGVRILLNVRGVCALVPGKKGLSENITVVSVVGRYLEHARIAYFRNGGAEEIYLSSADWLPRNLERRVELMFPILDEKLRGRAHDILAAYFMDNVKSHRLGPTGTWKRARPAEGEEPFSAQAAFYEAVKRRRALEEAPEEELQVRRRPSTEASRRPIA
jgi:polyphosphate kinase